MTIQAGRELDTLVAEKVMGWKRLTEGEIYGDKFDEVYPNAAHAGFDKNRLSQWWFDSLSTPVCPGEDLDADYDSPPRFAPSTSIAAAWEVVEQLRAGGFMWELYGYSGVEVCFQRPGGERFYQIVGSEGTSEELALAICLAACKAVGA